MIWQNSPKLVPEVTPSAQEFIEQYDTDWYNLRLGHQFDPETGEISDIVIYHIINRFTGVIEFQGTYLPTAIQHIDALTHHMKNREKDDLLEEVPSILN